jgi:flagellar biosynthesis anti-sigma factor FlgM
MKINGSELQAQLNVYKNANANAQGDNQEAKKTEQQTTPISLQDRVQLSGRGKMIAEAQKAVSSVPDVREELVAKIQTEVQNGTYKVDSEKAAEGILKESMTNLAAMS